MVPSSKAADNFVFLKVIYFIKMVNLKEGQILNVHVKVLHPLYYHRAQ